MQGSVNVARCTSKNTSAENGEHVIGSKPLELPIRSDPIDKAGQ